MQTSIINKGAAPIACADAGDKTPYHILSMCQILNIDVLHEYYLIPIAQHAVSTKSSSRTLRIRSPLILTERLSLPFLCL